MYNGVNLPSKNIDRKKPRIAVFIDAGNLWKFYKSVGRLIEFKKLPDFFAKKFKGEIFKFFHYQAYPKKESREYEVDSPHKFMTYLEKGLGFYVRKKALKTIVLRDGEGNIVYDEKTQKAKTIEKGNMDVEITIDAQHFSSKYDIAILLSGDSDFLPLVKFLRNYKKKKVYIFSTKNSVSSELRSGGDGYFDLADCPEIYGQKLKTRAAREKELNSIG